MTARLFGIVEYCVNLLYSHDSCPIRKILGPIAFINSNKYIIKAHLCISIWFARALTLIKTSRATLDPEKYLKMQFAALMCMYYKYPLSVCQ